MTAPASPSPSFGSSSRGVSRRDVVAALAIGAIPWPGVAADAAPRRRDGKGRTSSDEITKEIVAAAEVMAGVVYTDSERELIARTAKRSRDQAARRPTPPLRNEEAPATEFRPHRTARAARKDDSVAVTTASRPRTPDGNYAFASIPELGRALLTGETTSLELTRYFLERLRRFDGALRCVVNLCPERAEAEAKAADLERAAGKIRGPLHGIPYGAKDLFDAVGAPTTFGAEPFRNRVATEDAEVVSRLREAGAVLVAKLSLGELAMGDVWFGGRTNNPWNTSVGSSGSSAGSCAAVAAGLVPFALGTETLGSIVSPSMRCGVVGLRPTFGRVPTRGAMALCWSLDKVGPIARSASDAYEVFRAIADPAPTFSAVEPQAADAFGRTATLRVGYVPAWFEGRGDRRELERRALAATRDLAATLVRLEVPDFPYDALYTILAAESAAAFEDFTKSGADDQLAKQGPEDWPNFFRAARFLSAVDLIQADRLRRRVARAFADLFAPIDAMIGPSFGNPMLLATNYTGHPCLVVRAGFTTTRRTRASTEDAAADEGRAIETPHGVSLWAPHDREADLRALGAALEAKLDVASRAPTGY